MKAKSILFSIASVFALWGFASVSAVNIDTQIEDELNKKSEQEMVQKAQDLSEKITFTKVNSCESMEKVMSGFLETYRKLHPKRNYNYLDDYVLYEDSAESLTWGASNSVKSISAQTNSSDFPVRESAAVAWSADMWWISDFSTTNVQKVWVD